MERSGEPLGSGIRSGYLDAGLVRPARRPAGWHPPGPRPRTPRDRPEVWPQAREDLCYLTGDWRILQRVDGHRWSLDDLVTAWVAGNASSQSSPARICDLGCGIGAVLLMLAWRFPTAHLIGVEAQTVSVELARRSVAWNGAEDRCKILCGDLREPSLLPEDHSFDLITGTPPYLPLGTARVSQRIQWSECHFEHRGGVADYLRSAARLLCPEGVFVMCAAVRDTPRVESAACQAGLATTRRLQVVPVQGKAALFCVHVIRHAGPVARPPGTTTLQVRDRNGARTPEFLALRAQMGMPP